MSFTGIDLQRISLGALIIALGLLVDDAMITVESMVTRLERGDDKEQAASFAYTSTAFPMLTGTLVTVAGFVPIGFARSAAGEYTFSIFAVVAIALLASWVVAVVFSPLLGVWILKKPKAAHSEEPGPILRAFRRFLELAMRWRWITLLVTLGLCAALGASACASCRSSSSRPPTGPNCWSTCSCRRTRRSTPPATSRPASMRC